MKKLTLTFILLLSSFGAHSYVEALSLINKESFKEGYALLEKNYQNSKSISKKKLMANVLAFAPLELIKGNPLGYTLMALEDKKLTNEEKLRLFVRAGDLAFEQNKLGLSKINYLNAIGQKIEKEDLYSLYQLSWVLVNLNEYRSALKYIEKGLAFGQSDYFSSLSENYGQFSLEALLHLKRVKVKNMVLDDLAFERGAKKSLKLIKNKRHLSKLEKSLPIDRLKMIQREALRNKRYSFLQSQYCKRPQNILINLGEEEVGFVNNCKNPRLVKSLKGNSFLKMAFHHKKNTRKFCRWGLKSLDWQSEDELKVKYNFKVIKECNGLLKAYHLKSLIRDIGHRTTSQEAFKAAMTNPNSAKNLVALSNDELAEIPKVLLVPVLASKSLSSYEKVSLIGKAGLFLDREVIKTYAYHLEQIKRNQALNSLKIYFFPFINGMKPKVSESFLLLEGTKLAFRYNTQIESLMTLNSKLPQSIREKDKEYYLLELLHLKDLDTVISRYNSFEKQLSKKPTLIRDLLLSENWNKLSKGDKNNKILKLGSQILSGRKINGSYKRFLDELKLQPVAYPLYYLNKDIKRLKAKKKVSLAYKIGLIKKIKKHQKRVQKVAKEKNWLIVGLVSQYNNYIDLTQEIFKKDSNEQVKLLASEIAQWKLEIN